MAKMVNATLAYQKKMGDVNNSGNVAFTMFTMTVLLSSVFIFARSKFVHVHFFVP